METCQYLRSKGINLLTGEACGFSVRFLCDIENEQAKEYLRDFLGLPELTLAESWNHGIGSMMIGRETFHHDLFLFVALQEFEVMYKIKDNEFARYDWQGCTKDEWMTDIRVFLGNHPDWDYNVYFGQKNTRNTHEFTGRTI